jgi:Tol biopolymer transport system component
MRRVTVVVSLACGLMGLWIAPGRAIPMATNGQIIWARVLGLTTDSEVFGMWPDGSRIHQLSHNTQNDSFPAWSPNGRWIAFESSSADDMDIWLMQAGRRGQRNLTNDPGWADRYPSWSPDGTQIAFSRQSPFTGLGGVWVVNVDGTGMRQLTSEENADSEPSWSPDGRWIAFSSDRDDNLELYAVRPDGTGVRRLTDTPTTHEENPDWSPDGDLLAFDACEAPSWPCPGSPNYEVYTIDAAGAVAQLTTDPTIDANPAWSPDGLQIAFRSDRTGNTEVWKMAADGAHLVQLTFKPFQGGVDPDWGRRPE